MYARVGQIAGMMYNIFMINRKLIKKFFCVFIVFMAASFNKQAFA